ncbi:MAG: DUF5916 domain-containing protein [Acidobacteriota bacterium]
MKVTKPQLGWVLAAAFFCGVVSASATSSPGILKPLKTSTPPALDGELNDPVWAEAPSVTGFKTFIPDFGRHLSEETVAYMAYDSENLYFAFQCFDRDPDKIKATLSKRDDIRTDDMVCINLDSFNDQQSLYAFYANPLGVQMDSRYASNQEDYSVDFVWYSAGKVHDRGYVVEMRIPLKSIRYASGERVEMGIFFERRVSRRSEHGSYPALDPAKGYFFLTEMAPLEFFGLKKYTLLEVLPAFTYKQDHTSSEGLLRRERAAPDLSLTGKYGLTPSLILDATYNPDFSQVEADAGQVDVNLRYDLFFPEKRPFFLEGSENFNLAGISPQKDFLQESVHTRNIIDPQAGLKLTGKIGRKDSLAAIFAADETLDLGGLPAAGGEYAYFSIVRYKRALSADGSLGLFFTDREEGGRFNRVAGSDGQIRLGKSSLLSFHLLGSWTRVREESPREDGHALSLDYLYDTRNMKVRLGFQDLSTDFQTSIGFLTRNGLSRVRAELHPKFYPRSKVLPRIDLTLSSSQLRDDSSDLWETENEVSLGLTLVKSSRITLGYGYSTEVFLAQRFDTSGWFIQGSSQLTKHIYLRLTFRDGQGIRYADVPFQGRGKRGVAGMTYQPSENINWTLDFTYADFFRHPGGEKIYDYTIVRNRLTYQVNRYLFFRGIVEYNSYRRELLTDLLASFTYIPGTVIHVGYGSLYQRTRWADGAYVSAEDFLETKRQFFFKASYLWRL